MSLPILSIALTHERDIVLARQRARAIAAMLGFEGQDQTRISTAVSEITRNACDYARGGKVEFGIEGRTAPQVLTIRVADEGSGIRELPDILEGRFRSKHGMGIGIAGARRLMDHFEIESSERGTVVLLKKLLPRHAPLFDAQMLAVFAQTLAREEPRDAVEEVQRQNQELLGTLEELTRRQEELSLLNRELEDTNRGVVALFAELDEKADHLRRADEIKTRFISNMSHEFRTPVNSIQALARLMIDRSDGDLTPEQERQVVFIRKAADALSELVNDLLDLAKVEAGKTVVRPIEFSVDNLFGALRGMLRPLLTGDAVNLVFEEPEGLPPIHSDEGKVSQILRNLVSNALKFTERGEVRVTARLSADGKRVIFTVADTGIGIAPEDHDRIFQEFAQIDGPLQRRVKGTGLGLPLVRKLAGLLGGSVSVQSALGEGSTFVVEIPVMHEALPWRPPSSWDDPDHAPVLIVEDELDHLLLYEKYLSGTAFGILPARTLREAREHLMAVKPVAIVLDIRLQGEEAWSFLTELKRNPETIEIPVIIASTVDDRAKGMALGADGYLVKPLDRITLVQTLGRITSPQPVRKVLIVDDDEISRYLLRQSLASSRHVVVEATGGVQALSLLGSDLPDVICLDLHMPGMDGFQLVDQLKAGAETRPIPIVIVTSKALSVADRQRLERASVILSKEEVSRERIAEVIEDVLRAPEDAA